MPKRFQEIILKSTNLHGNHSNHQIQSDFSSTVNYLFDEFDQGCNTGNRPAGPFLVYDLSPGL
jgi:hypothetical protein